MLASPYGGNGRLIHSVKALLEIKKGLTKRTNNHIVPYSFTLFDGTCSCPKRYAKKYTSDCVTQEKNYCKKNSIEFRIRYIKEPKTSVSNKGNWYNKKD